MPYLVAAVALVALVAGLNLLLTYGVVRRLREHNEQLTQLATERAPELMRPVGSRPDDFDVATTDGQRVSRDALAGADPAGGAAVGFFSPGCPPCAEQAPQFAERAKELGRTRALAVLVGEPELTRDLAAQLEPVATVVVEGDGGALQRAFDVQGYPAMCTLDGDGRVSATSWTVAQLAGVRAA